MPFLAGIDCGTSFTKAVVLVEEGGLPRVLGKGRARSGVKVDEAAGEALEQLALLGVGLREARLDQLDPELVEPVRNAQLLLGRQRHPLALHAVAQGRVV